MTQPVMVLAGGLSPERDVSIRSGRRLAEALRTQGLDVVEADVDGRLLARLAVERPEVVVPVLHGAAGEDGSIREVLEALGLAYVGSRPDACRLAFDKPVAKALARRAGVRTPEGVALPHSTFRELGAPAVLDAITARLGLPLVVKPARGGSALGVGLVAEAAELPPAMVAAFAYGDVAMVEHYVAGTEIAVAVVDTAGEPEALPAVEIVPDGGLYDYTARYTAGTTEFFVPARLDDALLAEAARVALAMHAALGLRDWSRADLVVDADGRLWFLETNPAPGLTETSLLPQAVAAAGMDLGELGAALVRRAAGRMAPAEDGEG